MISYLIWSFYCNHVVFDVHIFNVIISQTHLKYGFIKKNIFQCYELVFVSIYTFFFKHTEDPGDGTD